MTVFVNELVVKATIADPAPNTPDSTSKQTQDRLNKNEIVEACITDVLKILERQKER